MAGSRTLAWVLTAAVAAVLFVCPPARAADEITIGVVDLQKIYSDAPRIKQYMAELGQFGETLEKKMGVRRQNMMLDDTEIKELIDLETKETKTDQDNSRIEELRDSERARDAELKDLQSRNDLDEQQKARLNELQDMQQKSKVTAEEIAKDYEDQWQKKTREYDTKAVADIREAINKVAEDKKFTFMLDKVAVFFGGIDATDDVIAKLDRKIQ